VEPGVEPGAEGVVVVGAGSPATVVGVGMVVGGVAIVVGVASAPVTVKAWGAYVVSSDGHEFVKHAASTGPGTASAFGGTVNEPLHDPFAATGMFALSARVADVIVT